MGGVARDAVDAGPVKETKLESLTSESALGEPGAFVHAITVPIVLRKSADETHETDVAVILAGGRAHARLLEEFARGRRLDGFALFDAPLRHVPRSFAIASLAAQHLSSIVEHDRRRAPSVSFTVHRHASTLGIRRRLLLLCLCLCLCRLRLAVVLALVRSRRRERSRRLPSHRTTRPRPRRHGRARARSHSSRAPTTATASRPRARDERRTAQERRRLDAHATTTRDDACRRGSKTRLVGSTSPDPSASGFIHSPIERMIDD